MHSHSGGGSSSSGSMSMSMSMAMGASDPFALQRIYWAFVGAAIGVAIVVNVINRLLAAQRMSAKPEGRFLSAYATVTALSREVSLASISIPLLGHRRLNLFSMGKAILVLGNLMLVLILCFYKLDTNDQWQWETIGYQTGFVTAAQLPLVVLLAGKRNIIGFFIGTSYERLSWLHRWISRTVFLTATLHMGFWFRSWNRYDYIGQKIGSDRITQRGLAAWCILLWILLSSFAPIRRWNYEIFVFQHVLTVVGFLAAVFLHLPAEVKVWIWIPIVLYAFDRVIRLAFILYRNLGISRSTVDGWLSCRAEIEYVGAGLSRITIRSPPLTWNPGQHIFLQCHGIAPLQSHPFTIASLPADGRMDLLVKARSGATKRFLSHAQNSLGVPSIAPRASMRLHAAVIDGPYGYLRPLRQFDSVLFIAGGCGATFTVPLMRDIICGWKEPRTSRYLRQLLQSQGAVTRRIRFVWIVKSRTEWAWVSSQILQACQDVQQMQLESPHIALEVLIYTTCNTTLGSINHTQAAYGDGTKSLRKPEPRGDQISLSLEKSKTDQNSLKSNIAAPSEAYNVINSGCTKYGGCCCTQIIEHEITGSSQEQADNAVCRCNRSSSVSQNEVASDGDHEPATPHYKDNLVDNRLVEFLTGRPNCRNLIQTVLERAQGESAVVVCGPAGLNTDVRESVVSLSDERAVCKGSGAHGVYFWEEGFSY